MNLIHISSNNIFLNIIYMILNPNQCFLMHFYPNISRHQTSRSLFFYLTEFNIIMFDFIFCHFFFKFFKEKISKPINDHNIPCFIRDLNILTVLVGIKSVISSLSVQIQVVHCFQINFLVNKASFFFSK